MTRNDHPPGQHPAPLPRHWKTLLICSGMLLLAVALRLNARGDVLLPYTSGPALPSACLTRQVLHMDCPGCGMTRSFIAMAHGQARRAFSYHRLGPVIFLYVLLQVPLQACVLLTGRTGLLIVRPRYATAVIWAFIIALWLNWGYNLLTGAAFH